MIPYWPTTGLTTVRMPLSFTAFCAHRQSLYLRYISVRVGGAVHARPLVQAALGDLAMSWPQALRSPSPAAASWRLLTARAAGAAGHVPRAPYDILGEQHADVLVLRYRLGLPAHVAAELMGIDEPVLAGRLQAALRAFR
ncbi:hypothetical protein ACFO3J_27235 [Streptomyces polygonati]|uniref:RNA polymerase sigma factor 70 region 4 type 2 domain-containing protein n=1 Tax=Streptomyces polygonati TaxID=1617087 RepID=A0ABV8HT12_9ACTN